jgi:hypothetical protein
MITERKQLITCFISTKSEILRDHHAPRARAPRAGLRKAITVTTHHFSQRHCPTRGRTSGPVPDRWRS